MWRAAGRLGLLAAPAVAAGGATLALADGAAPASGRAPRAPVVETVSVSKVHVGSARLAGTVDPNGQDTSYRFQYGTTTSYGSTTPVADAGAATAPEPVRAPVTGLMPGTTYHYRLSATNAAGTATSEDATFRTLDPRLKGRFRVRLRVLSGSGAFRARHARSVHRRYRFAPHCGGARCRSVHLKREGRRGRFGSTLHRRAAGVYAGTERFRAGRCDDGLRFHSVAKIRVTVRRLAGDRASKLGGRFALRARGCASGRERARLHGTLRG